MRRIALFLLFLVLSLWIIQEWALPQYLENHLLPRLAGRAGFADFSCRVRHVGFSGLEMGPIQLGRGDEPVLRVGSAFVSYSPFGLLQKHLKNIHITGLTLVATRQDGPFTIAGLPLAPGKTNGIETEAGLEKSGFQLPVSFRSVTFESSELILKEKAQVVRVPFHLEIESPKTDLRFHVAAGFRIGGRSLNFEGEVDLQNRDVRGKLSMEKFPLRQIADWNGMSTQTLPEGTADLLAEFNFQLNPFSIREAGGELRFDGLSWGNDQFSISPSEPFIVRAAWEGGQRIDFQVPPVHFDGNAAGTFNIKSLAIDLAEAETFFDGVWSLTLNRILLGEKPVVLEKGLEFSGVLGGKVHPEEGWSAEINAQRLLEDNNRHADMRLEKEKASLWLGKDQFICRAMGGKTDTRLDCELSLEGLKGTFPKGRVQVDALQSQGRMNFVTGEKSSTSLPSQGRISVQAKGVKINQDSFQVVLPQLEAVADFETGDMLASWRGDLRMGKARFSYPSQNFHAENISLSLPWQYPITGDVKSGEVRVRKMTHQGHVLGGVKAYLRQSNDGWFWNGQWDDILRSSMTLHFKGQTDQRFSEVAMSFGLEQTSLSLDKLLTAYYPKVRGLRAKTDIHLQGKFMWESDRFSCPVHFVLENLEFSDSERKLHGNGVALELEFLDVLNVYAAQVQRLKFDKLLLADVVLENGGVHFQVGRELELLVEKLTFSWCGGRVHSESFRVRPEVENFDIVLYCDRINLAQLLEQLGAARAEGTGSLNGRIPVRYENGKFSVMDGFLFSTPGEGGVLHVSGMENLTAGLPGDNQYFGQLKLAEEALKDYEYKWARLGVNSENDDLMIRVQMDGKPAKLLPFVYRKEFGGFVRAEANFPGSRFEGIRLDLNFRLPLDKILEYKNLLKLMN
jgi:Dicarboxylate transport